MRKVIVVGLVVAVLVFLALFMRVAPYIGSTGGGHSGSPYSYTGAPPSGSSPTGLPRLHSLDGRLYCMDAGWMTNDVWARMRDYNASDPAVKPYIEWLRNALAPDPGKALNVPWYPRYRYWWFNDRRGWKVPVPDTDSLVRIGLVRLPFGAGLVVTAYQSRDGLTIVVHGTIINETGWRELLTRTIAFAEYPSPTLFGWGTWYGSHKYYYVGDYSPVPGVNVKVRYVNYWVLWRAMLEGRGSYLDIGNATVPIKRVVVLIEMPVHVEIASYNGETKYLWTALAEPVYWSVIGEPALALGIRLAYPPTTDTWKLYKTLTVSLTKAVVTTDTHHSALPGPVGEFQPTAIEPELDETPILLRALKEGVCQGYTTATTLFASNALGAVTVAISVPGHYLSGLVLPSRIYGTPPNTIIVPFDVDGDGRNDSSVKIVDTAGYSIRYIEEKMDKGTYLVPPFMWRTVNMEKLRYALYWVGVPQAIMGLPGWLKTPWLDDLMSMVNYTGIVEEARRVFAENYYRPEAIYQPMPVEQFVKTVANLTAVKTWTRYMPPSYALALGKVIGKLPVIYAGETPRLCGTGIVCRTAEGVVVLAGRDRHYSGTAEINGRNVTVLAHLISWVGSPFNEYDFNITVLVDGNPAYTGKIRITCSAFGGCCKTIAFEYGGTAYIVTLKLKPSNSSNSGSNGSGSLPPAMVNAVVNATWDGHEYRGNTTVDGTLIVVLVWRSSTGRWVVDVWVGEDCAYSGPLGWSLRNEFTVWFTWKGTSYKVTVHIAKTGGGGSSTRAGTSINAAVVLRPVYANISSPWGPVPVVRYLRGTSIVNATNVTVLAWPANGWGEYSVAVYVNGSRAHTCSSSLPATIEFRHGGTEYRVAVEPPRPPLLNQTIGLELEPERTARVPLANGTLVNITIYRVNQTIRIGNTTIHVEGHVSRVSVDLIISVYGVPPANYTAITKGLNATAETTYPGALIIMIHYMVPTNSNGIPTQLIPEGTALETIIQQLSLTIQVRVEG